MESLQDMYAKLGLRIGGLSNCASAVSTQGGTEAQEPAFALHAHACSLRCTLGAIRSGTRYAKWAGGSR
jgi:hypothetical protein